MPPRGDKSYLVVFSLHLHNSPVLSQSDNICGGSTRLKGAWQKQSAQIKINVRSTLCNFSVTIPYICSVVLMWHVKVLRVAIVSGDI